MGLHLVTIYTLNQTVHWFAVGLFFPVMVLFLLDKDLNSLQVGTAVAMFSVALVCLELPTGGLSDSIGRKRVYLMSVSVLFASYAWIVVSWSYVTLLLGIFGMGREGRAMEADLACPPAVVPVIVVHGAESTPGE